MKLSVIVSTLNRENAIIPCLDSIVRAFNNAAPIEAEIVVVDNGSEDDTFAVVRNWVSSHSYHVQLLSEPRKGLAIARNRGMKAAQGELLAFTDDDCRLSEDYVKDLLRHDAADAGEVLRGGRVELGDTNDLPLTILKGETRERWTKASQSAKFKNLGDCILGANMVIRRETAIRLGNFDERLGAGARIPAGEDTDYTFRAYLAGLAIEFVSDMTIFHFHGRKLPSDGKKLFKGYMEASGALYLKHFFYDPDLCRQFVWDVKDSIKEVFSGVSRTGLEDIGISSRDRVFYTVKGALKFATLSLMRK